MDVFHAETQQGEQHDDCFLFVSRDVVGDGQFVDVVQGEHFLQFQGDELAEVFVFVSVLGNMLEYRIAGRVGREHTVTVVCSQKGRHDTVGGEENGAVEGVEFLRQSWHW